ncbi:hypothetical protein [Nocardiopsis ganjiahuensis]|uniref:hypothetical protein n=1 Tax=Nocardiopsis ganjiahuensis TaxID=239984 RepID=UPI000348A63C|nr:hypothetical protein [Nocardiopsis ganjiahuensis]
MIRKLSEMGVTSEMAYCAGGVSIGLTVLTWLTSLKKEAAGKDAAERKGLFVGEWAPTFFALGVALRLEENRK